MGEPYCPDGISSIPHDPCVLAESIRKLVSPYHDQYQLAAAAGLYPRTIRNILSKSPVSPITLAKVGNALERGQLAPKPAPAGDATDLASRVYRCMTASGGTVAAARLLNVAPLVIAKLVYEKPVNQRYRLIVERRLDSAERHGPVASGDSPPLSLRLPAAKENLNLCRQAYDLYQTHGTLEAVGRRLQLSRERVRQLITRGVAYGVIPATPHYTQRKAWNRGKRAVATRTWTNYAGKEVDVRRAG